MPETEFRPQDTGMCPHMNFPATCSQCRKEDEGDAPETKETETALPEGVESRFTGQQFERAGYREYSIPEGMTVMERVDELLKDESTADVVMTRDGKLMVASTAKEAVGFVGENDSHELLRDLDAESADDKKKLADDGVELFTIKTEPTRAELRKLIDDEMVTGRLAGVIRFKDDAKRIGFKYRT